MHAQSRQRAADSEAVAADGSPSVELLEAEVRALRARLLALERELVEAQAQANAAVAQWQERAYWLDRWHLDLNALMRRRGAAELRGLLRAIRVVFRIGKRAKRRLTP